MAQTLTQLRAFVSVARNQSVQLAARELFVTQPSVSSAVAALSREVGAELLERNGRGVRLTQAGQAYLPYATRMLGLIEEGQAAVQATTVTGTDAVRLIAASTPSDHFLPAVIDAFRQQGNCRVTLTVANRPIILEAVAAHDADLGITGALEFGRKHPNLRATPFLGNEMIVVAREKPDDLGKLTWLQREEGSTMRVQVERLLTSLGLQNTADQLVLGSAGAVKQALMLGLGAALMPRLVVAQELATGRLCELDVEGTPINHPWHAVVATDVPLRRVVRSFYDFLQSTQTKSLLSRGWA